MRKWSERAKVHFSERSQEVAPITPETHLLGVLGAAAEHISANEGRVLGVLGVAPPSISRKRGVSLRTLMAVGMKVCEMYKDSDAAKEDMCIQLAEVPEEQRDELLLHFKSAYGVTA